MKSNTLYYGDCLDWMDRWLEEGAQESIDLIYLDPPFNSSATYSILFGKTPADAQFRAFNDTWFWDTGAEQRYQSFKRAIARPAHGAIMGLRTVLGKSGMLAYLTYMAERLERMHRLLKPTGSLYLHCDPYASHYLKIVLDAIFNLRNFQNEIVWCYSTGGATPRRFSRKHDVLFFYGKKANPLFNTQRMPYTSAMSQDPKHKHKFNKDGRIMLDWWSDITPINPLAKERLGYPTQKPEALLERILQASSNEGDVVLDPFCGCGTTIAVAERLQRRWAGVDISAFAIDLIRQRRLKNLRIPPKVSPSTWTQRANSPTKNHSTSKAGQFPGCRASYPTRSASAMVASMGVPG